MRELDIDMQGLDHPTSKTPFCVKYGDRSDGDRRSLRSRYFNTEEDANQFAETIVKQCEFVWMLEKGEFATGTPQLGRGWVNYWWSPAVAHQWGTQPNRGYCRPEQPQFIRERRTVRYRPGGRNIFDAQKREESFARADELSRLARLTPVVGSHTPDR
jgi:hypothetical protein